MVKLARAWGLLMQYCLSVSQLTSFKSHLHGAIPFPEANVEPKKTSALPGHTTVTAYNSVVVFCL